MIERYTNNWYIYKSLIIGSNEPLFHYNDHICLTAAVHWFICPV